MSEINRRSFLEMVGMVGGSAALYQVMTSMGLAQASAPGPLKLEGSGQGKSFLILGAGLAGMASAYELRKAGYDVTILEYNARAGGRCWTLRGGDVYTELGGFQQHCEFDPGLYLNPGPWRIPYHHYAYMNYAREFGVKLEVFPQVNYNAYIHRKAGNNQPGTKVRLREPMADMQGHVSELLAKSVAAGNNLDTAITGEDRERLLEALRGWGFLDKDYRYSKSLATSAVRGYAEDPGARLQPGEPATPLTLQSILSNRLWSDLATGMLYEFQSTIFEPVGGMDAMARAFEARVRPLITYRARVTELSQGADGVTAVYEDLAGGGTKTVKADYCICTIPLSILSQVKLNVGQDLERAIKKVPYAPSFKAGIQYKRRFWEQDDAIFGGITYTDLPIQTVSYPANNYLSRGKGVVLSAYMFGPDAVRFSGMNPKDRLQEVLRQNTLIHPQAEKEFDNGISVGWHRVPWTLGCYGLYTDETRKNDYPTLCARHDRLILAGEHTSYWNGWQEGALLAAITAVEEMHKFAQQS
ncbi:flavin monoamine oxidase family protein [Deinococcus sp. S9]|uniref:flavin monoamine oxidase family protein n=1 Tax=Deinococcus sp. S9 TaxID=2545754 RepID=UPI001056D7E6|nr:flavin monoamine oxidase family protein [Deinococcus sp. S9]TDE85861.1 flavin monoamine oxidase family protein [Deinococcus sp. S9]